MDGFARNPQLSEEIVKSDQISVEIELEENACQVAVERKAFGQENIDTKPGGDPSPEPLPDLNSDEYEAWWDSLDTQQRDAELWRQVNLLDAQQKIAWWKSMDSETKTAWWKCLNSEQKVYWWQSLDVEQREEEIRYGN